MLILGNLGFSINFSTFIQFIFESFNSYILWEEKPFLEFAVVQDILFLKRFLISLVFGYKPPNERFLLDIYCLFTNLFFLYANGFNAVNHTVI